MKKIVCLLALPLLFLLVSFTHNTLSWVAIGDSITYLNDHKDETGNRLTKGYMTQVTERLPYIHYTNQGHNGWTSQGIARSIEKLGIPPADVYSVFLGTNDWWHSNHIGTWADFQNNTGDSTVYGSFKIILDKLHQLNKDASIILITPMPRSDFVSINNYKNNAYGSYKEKDGATLEQFVEAIKTIGKNEGLRVVDLYHERKLAVPHLVKFKRLKDPSTGQYKDYTYPDYTSVPFNPADEYPYPVEAIDMTYDGLHPSDKGDALIAKRLVKILKKL
ncbi:MAG: SGNH/GDSL hydrolase family protein [Bacteroidetes bacterium]|nr:SGNH/GDSL hydrolase family protein [Bacteroidota bacterium]